MSTEIREIPLKDIEITDQFWRRYIKLVKDVIIPYQWSILNDSVKVAEPSHCIHNFKVAAGVEEGEFLGAVFQDTDVAKWLEAVAYCLEYNPDEELQKQADETIALIGKAQQADGYLDTYFIIKEPGQRFLNLQEGHELYTAGHMIEAAVAYFQATGKREFLDIVSRLADLLCRTFGPEAGKNHGYPGHQEIELALVKLYSVTGTRAYLELAKHLIDQRGVGENYFLEEGRLGIRKQIFPELRDYDPSYSQSHVPVREQQTAEGHAVRAVYMCCAMADLVREEKDETLLAACQGLWENITQKRMYLTGGIGSSGILERFTTDYDLPNDRGYAETCASIGMALFGKRMAQITKDASYIETVELELYNNILAGIALDGKSFFYVNPLEVWPDNCMDRTSLEHVKHMRQKWFGVACCPPNIARTLASLGQYIYFMQGDRLYVNLYVSGTTSFGRSGPPQEKADASKGTAEENRAVIHGESFMPWKGRCIYTVESDGNCPSPSLGGEQDDFTGGEYGGTRLSIAFRVPAYAKSFTIWKNGARLEELRVERGYALADDVRSGDELELSWDMPPEFVYASPLVRADSGRIAIKKGPVVYCLEEIDNGTNLAAVFVDAGQELKERYDEELLGGTLTIELIGKKLDETAWKSKELYHTWKPEFKEVSLKAIPYAFWNNRGPGEMMVWMKELFHEE